MKDVTVYGADWCGLTKRALAHLDEVGVPYRYVNVEADRRASEWVKRQNHGKELKPTVDVGGTILAEPSNDELDAVLFA